LALALVALAFLDVVFYFRQYQVTRPEFEIRAAQSRWETGLGLGYQVWVLGHTWQPYDRETNEYLLHGQDGGNLLDPAHELPVPPMPGKGVAFVFFPDNQRYEGMVRAMYPGGMRGEVRSHTGVHLFYTYVVPPSRGRSH
jgi:hypothetical protein